MEKHQVYVPVPARYEDLRDGRRVRLTRNFLVSLGWALIVVRGDSGEFARDGFVTDFASVPWFFRRVLPQFGPWNEAAIVHDWLYRTGQINGRAITRRTADEIFLAVMLANEHCPRWQARAMYVGVRLGAFGMWAKYRADRSVDYGI